MKKLTLDLTDLRVEGFATGAEPGARGTVRAHETRITEFCSQDYKCRTVYGQVTCAPYCS